MNIYNLAQGKVDHIRKPGRADPQDGKSREFRLLVELLVIAVSIIAMLATSVIPLSTTLKDVVIGIGTGTLAGAVLALLETVFHADVESLLKPRLERLVPDLDEATRTLSDSLSILGISVEHQIKVASERLQDQSIMYEAGLTTVLPRRDMDKIFRNIDNATRIDMAFNTARSIMFDNEADLTTAIRFKSCSIRLLITDPDNFYWEDRIVRDAQGPDINVAEDVLRVKNRLNKWHAEWKDSTTPQLGTIQVRMFKHVPTCSIVIIYYGSGKDERAMCWVTPYLPYVNSSNVPTFGIRRVASSRDDKDLFYHFSRAFEDVWKHSSTLVCKDIAFNGGQHDSQPEHVADQPVPPTGSMQQQPVSPA